MTRELPPSNLEPNTVAGILPDSLEICSWSPERLSQSAPPTQVHLVIGLRKDLQLAIRFTTQTELDDVIEQLTAHRRFVWGSSPK